MPANLRWFYTLGSWAIPEKIIFWNPPPSPGFFCFFTLPLLEIPDKPKLHPWKFDSNKNQDPWKFCRTFSLSALEIQLHSQLTLEILHAISMIPLEILCSHPPAPFPPSPPPIWIFSGIAHTYRLVFRNCLVCIIRLRPQSIS